MAAGPTGGSGGAHAAWVMNLLTDLAFNLLIFFVVCASSAQEQKGKPQQVPSTQSETKQTDTKPQTVEVAMTRTSVTLNGKEVTIPELRTQVAALLASKTKPEDKLVEVKSAKDTPYHVWIRVTGAIEEAGGVVTIQVDVEKDVIVR
jgi:biopolymer transport protein ExbD